MVGNESVIREREKYRNPSAFPPEAGGEMVEPGTKKEIIGRIRLDEKAKD